MGLLAEKIRIMRILFLISVGLPVGLIEKSGGSDGA